MENKLAELYNELANHITSIIPTDFEEVYCMYEVENGGSGKTCMFYFKDSNTMDFVQMGTIPITYNVSKEIFRELKNKLYDILDKIYNVFIENKQETWTLLDMYFNKQGKFKVDFIYDAISEEYAHFERGVIWAYQKMGITYKEGTYPQKVVNQFIEKNNENL